MDTRQCVALSPLLFLCLPGIALAVPGDQLFFEDFESGVPGWAQTAGASGSWGVNNAFGYNAGYVAGDSEVRVETPAMDLSGIAGARVTLTVIRGKQTTQSGVTVSNKPENDENFELDFVDADGNWQTVLVQYGGGTAGEVFNSVVDLPSAALHANFQLRFGTWGGDGWDGEPDDFWHFDDVQIIETASAGGDVSECTFGEDFEGGLGNWTVSGAAAISTATYNSPDHSLALPANGSEVVSAIVDLDGKTATLTAWVRAGGWPGGPDKPESSDELEFEYQRSNGNWSSLYTFCIDCSNTSSQKDVDVGGIALLSIDLPNNALHEDFRLRIRNDSSSSSTTSDVWHVDNVCITASAPADHISIEHDGSAVNCQPEVVIIKAHAADHTVAKEYIDEITLTTGNGHGDWSLAVGLGSFSNFGNGLATYAFSEFDEGVVTLKLHNTYVETDNINVGDGTYTEHVDEDPDLVFAATGFQFVTPGTGLAPGVQIAGKPSATAPSNAIAIQAIRTSDTSGACEAAFVGSTLIEMALSCESPASCAAASGNINGSNIATGNSGTPASWTSLNVDFGSSSSDSATLNFRYDEAGAVKLHARKTLSPSDEIMSGNSTNIIVRPFGLYLAVDQGSINAINPAASAPGGSAFENAGAPFRVEATAVGWQSADDANNDGIADGHADSDPTNNADLSDNPALANFAQEGSADSIALTAALQVPSGGTDPGLSGTTSISGFTSGAASQANVRWAEVGVMEIAAAIADGDYLGAGDITGRSGYVGRFVPNHFTTAVDAHGCSDGNAFTYSGQPLATFTVMARDASGGVTQNFGWSSGSGFSKDITLSDPASTPPGSFNSGIAKEDFTNGSASISGDVIYTFTNKETAPHSLTVRATDTDAITSNGAAEGTTQIRSARLTLSFAASPNYQDATGRMRVESWDGTGWLTEVLDVCTSAGNSMSDEIQLTFFVLSGHLGMSPGDSLANGITMTNGAGSVTYSAPGLGVDSSMLSTLNVPAWLQYDWDSINPGLEDPSHMVRFLDNFATRPGMIHTEEIVQ